MNLTPVLRIMTLMIVLVTGIIASCGGKEGPESAAINFLNACRDGDEKTITKLSLRDKSLPVLKWRKLSSESHRDDQGTISAFLEDLEVYRKGKARLLEIAREHQRLFGQEHLASQTFKEQNRILVAERDSLLAKMERLKERHAGMFFLLDAGVLPQILGGKPLQHFSGPYDVKIYFFFAEISSVTSHWVKIQHHIKIELAKVSMGDIEAGWLVYRINDLTE